MNSLTEKEIQSDTLNIKDIIYEKIPILDLKRWVEAQIAKGANFVETKIEWGYYNEIDEINLKAY